MSAPLVFASTNPQYDNRLCIVHENCQLRIPAEHFVYVHTLLFLFCFDIQNNFGTQHVLQMLRASEKDLPVSNTLKWKYYPSWNHFFPFKLCVTEKRT